MIEFYEIICAIVVFITGYLLGDFYTTEKRKEELFEAKWDRIQQKRKEEEYKSECESYKTSLKNLQDEHNSLKNQLKEVFEVLEEDGYETYLEYSPLVGWNGFIHKKRDKK